MPDQYEVKPAKSNIGKRIISSLGISFIFAILFSVALYFLERSINFAITAFIIIFVFFSLLMFFLYGKGLVSDVQLKKIAPNYKILLELNYSFKEMGQKWWIGMIIFISIFFMIGVSTMIFNMYIISAISFGMLIFFGILFYLEFFKLKVDCKLTDKGIIIGSIISKHVMINWEDIVSYELDNGLVTLSVKGFKGKAIFPVLDQQKRVVQILNDYISG